jgi:hypothetical protein
MNLSYTIGGPGVLEDAVYSHDFSHKGTRRFIWDERSRLSKEMSWVGASRFLASVVDSIPAASGQSEEDELKTVAAAIRARLA